LTRTVACVLFSVAVSTVAVAQDPAPARTPPPPLGTRKITVLAGGGVAVAGSGLQAEAYFDGDRFSALAGVGYSYEIEDGEDDDLVSASGVGLAGGLRVYTDGRVHRGFLELAYSPIGYETAFEGFPQDRLRLMYGPSLQAGWQMTRPAGFTLVLAAGVGHARATDDVEGFTDAVAFIGLGKTWRRK
jgi:hypothetical protein